MKILSIIFSVVFAIVLFYTTFISIAFIINANPKVTSSIACAVDMLMLLVVYKISSRVNNHRP